MIKFLLGVILTVLLLAGVGAYFLIGVGPRDLGIRYTVEDSKAAWDKVGTEIIPITEGMDKKDFTLEGKKELTMTMDSKELTAHSNNRPWKNYPVKNLQIKIGADGTIEGSAILVVAKALPYAMAMGYSEAQIREAMTKYNIPSVEVPFYVKGKGQVINDKVSVNAQMVEIGRVAIPQDIVSQANKEAEQVLNDVIQKHSQSFHAESLTFNEGKMNFVGTAAEKEYVVTK